MTSYAKSRPASYLINRQILISNYDSEGGASVNNELVNFLYCVSENFNTFKYFQPLWTF